MTSLHSRDTIWLSALRFKLVDGTLPNSPPVSNGPVIPSAHWGKDCHFNVIQLDPKLVYGCVQWLRQHTAVSEHGLCSIPMRKPARCAPVGATREAQPLADNQLTPIQKRNMLVLSVKHAIFGPMNAWRA